MKKKMMKGFLALFVLAAMAMVVIAETNWPYGPDTLTRNSDQRANLSTTSSKTENAQGGNVTRMTINSTIITQRWQGYFGNLTGQISLQDGSGNVFYSWGQGELSVAGEIYASNATISDWASVVCVNVSPNAPGYNCKGENEFCLTVATVESHFGITATDSDGLNETFTGREWVGVGSRNLYCPSTNAYSNSAAVAGVWNETLLTVNNTNNTVIFAAEVEPETIGFNNLPWDFQLMVLDDGTVAAPTPYNFYVELV